MEFSTRYPVSLGRFVAIFMGLMLIGALKVTFFLVYRGRVFNVLGRIWINMPAVLQTPKKLVLSDKGFIGMACSGTQLGDKICFLAGRTSPVVLREMRRGDRMQYTVVGESYVYLSWADREIYSGFIDQIPHNIQRNKLARISRVRPTWAAEAGRRECVNAEERERCVQRYREEGMLQRYELV